MSHKPNPAQIPSHIYDGMSVEIDLILYNKKSPWTIPKKRIIDFLKQKLKTQYSKAVNYLFKT